MSGFKVGDRVVVVEPVPAAWQKTGTVVQVIFSGRHDECIYEIRLDEGPIRRLPARNIEPLASLGPLYRSQSGC